MYLRVFSSIGSLRIFEEKQGFTNDKAIDFLILQSLQLCDVLNCLLNKYF